MPYQPRATFNNPYGPQVTFRTEDVLPPPAYYVSPDDRVALWVVTDVPNISIEFQVRLLDPFGEVKVLPYIFTPTILNTWYPVFQASPVEGYILGALCWANNPPRGQCYVCGVIMRGQQQSFTNAGEVLMQGYINNLNILSYPSTPLQSTFNGRGSFLTVSPGNVTGGNWTITPGNYVLWRVCSLKYAYQTSAAAGTRSVGVQLVDPSMNQVGFWFSNAAQGPSSTMFYSFSPGAATMTESIIATDALADPLYVPGQWSLQGITLSADPGDNFNTIRIQVEEWLGV